MYEYLLYAVSNLTTTLVSFLAFFHHHKSSFSFYPCNNSPLVVFTHNGIYFPIAKSGVGIYYFRVLVNGNSVFNGYFLPTYRL